MTETPTDRCARLEAEEKELILGAFDAASAWDLGCRLRDRAVTEGLALLVDVRSANQILFHAAVGDAPADLEHWVRRKSALTLRMGCSSALFHERILASGGDPSAIDWLPVADYTTAGGSFPIRVAGVGLVAAVTLSGLPGDDDHDYIVQALRSAVHDS